MSNIINLCKDTCDQDHPFFIKAICDGNDGRIVVTQNDIEVYSLPYKLHKTITNYETFKKVLRVNSVTKINLDINPVFYLFSPVFSSSFNWRDRNVQIVTQKNIDKVEGNLYNTPDINVSLGLINNVETSSYNPTIKILKVYPIEEVFVEITDLKNNAVNFTFNKYDYSITLNERLIGNNIYFFKIKYLSKNVKGEIVETTVKNYSLRIIKKKLIHYDFIEIYEDNETKIDVDNDIDLIIKDVPKGISLEQLNINIPEVYDFIIKDKRLIKEGDNYTIKIKIEIVGLLKSNSLYKIYVSNISDVLTGEEYEDREILFRTNTFHTCVHKSNFSDVYLRSVNRSDESDYFYLVNDSDKEISVYGLIGYLDKDYKIRKERC